MTTRYTMQTYQVVRNIFGIILGFLAPGIIVLAHTDMPSGTGVEFIYTTYQGVTVVCALVLLAASMDSIITDASKWE